MLGVRRPQWLQRVCDAMDVIAPLRLKESWDNVGLLVDPPMLGDAPGPYNILLTNDLTEKVAMEALRKKANAIVSYHPTPFRKSNRFDRSDVTARIVLALAKHDVAVYSPHVCLDCAVGGINDWILQAFGITSSLPITVRPVDADGTGIGRKAALPTEMTVKEAVEKVKAHFKLSHVRVGAPISAMPEEPGSTPAFVNHVGDNLKVLSVACCAGSGADVLRGCKEDLLVTGEMSHHEVLAHTHEGRTVILTDHSNCERGYLPTLKSKLEEQFSAQGCGGEYNVFVTEVDADPLLVW
mmetsp:Transcript_20242/g.51444  ORF Transcript_20242/g.51444 Transcript_20242/m.51444 type:complete len:296 (+) Transcript_20242:35-922(+)